MVVVSALWQDLGLEAILDRLPESTDRLKLADWTPLLVASRLRAPASVLGLARRLETDLVCDRQGWRWVPEWRDDVERAQSRMPHMRVEM